MEQVDLSSLTPFGNVAAGHEGVLQDPDGSLVIKPCTQTEIQFYTQAVATAPLLAIHMPSFLGTLRQQDPDDDEGPGEAENRQPQSTAAALGDDPGPLFGKKISSGISIVLSNVTAGFQKPNVLDIKLGARLWDDEAAPEKRARLDKVAAETTSGSLGFRIAGMRVWNGKGAPFAPAENVRLEDDSEYRVYNKMYGRAFSAEDVVDGILEFIRAEPAGVSARYAVEVLKSIESRIGDIYVALTLAETVMYSASILIVYEGDPAASAAAVEQYKQTKEEQMAEKQRLKQQQQNEQGKAERMTDEDGEDGDDGDSDSEDLTDSDFDDEEIGKTVDVKLIDFAHARFVDGNGPDKNVIDGIKNVLSVIHKAIQQLDK